MPPPVRAKFEDRSFFRLRNIQGVPKFRNWVTYPRPHPLRGQFVVRGQELPTAYMRAKFEDRSFTRLRNIEGVPKFRNWVTYPRPRPLRGQFVVRGQELPTAYGRSKFEGRSFIRLRNIGTFRCGALIDPVTLTFDLLTLMSLRKSRVTWAAPVQSFVFLGLLVFELEPMYATSDRQTDRQTDGRRTPITA